MYFLNIYDFLTNANIDKFMLKFEQKLKIESKEID